MIDIEPISPAAPIARPVKIHRDEDRRSNQNSGSKSEKKQAQLDDDADDVQHIDEIV
ncbi:MAG: hypothetical protein RQ733_02520 [Methyloprofundus sp.]|nr:hypothetical protein [Methyloprofundus sp.]